MRALSARWIVTGSAPPIRDGVVVVGEDGVVQEVRPRTPSDDVERFDGVLLPGLVNAHTHLEGSAFAGRIPAGGGLAGFLGGYIDARRSAPEDAVRSAANAAVDALLEAGTALVGEVTNSLAAVPTIAASPLHAAVFHEITVLSAAQMDEIRDAGREARNTLPELPPRITVAEAAHATYSSPPPLIRSCFHDAEESGCLTSLHVAEHADERRFLADRTGPLADLLAAFGIELDWPPPGRGPVEHLDGLGALGRALLAVHVVDSTPDERRVLHDRGTPVVLCPRSNDHIGGRLPDLPAILEEGLRPGLGTDSLASSPSLDVLEEARALREAYPDVSCATLVSMCTAWGAEAMGRPSLGSLRAGAAPGVLLAVGEGDVDDPERWLVEACPPRRWLASPGGAA